jgi:hypothetical protein
MAGPAGPIERQIVSQTAKFVPKIANALAENTSIMLNVYKEVYQKMLRSVKNPMLPAKDHVATLKLSPPEVKPAEALASAARTDQLHNPVTNKLPTPPKPTAQPRPSALIPANTSTADRSTPNTNSSNKSSKGRLYR